MNLLPQQLVNELKARAVKGLVQQPAEHGLTTLYVSRSFQFLDLSF